jgi:GntR family transcriptional repressor for pyruvate dehydrogenase complex
VFKPFQNTRKAEQVVQAILAAVGDKRLGPGERLPDENTMALEFEVSRNCVREALRILETMGVVQVRHGRGCFVVDTETGSEPPKLWLYWLKAFQSEVLDLLEAREAVETKAAQLAAARSGPKETAEVERLAGEMALAALAPDTDIETFARLDRAFHAAVTRASHNSFLVSLAPGSWAASDRQATFRIEGRMLLSARQHQEISAAIAARDAEAAGRAMSRHIRDVIDQIRERLKAAEEAEAGAGAG